MKNYVVIGGTSGIGLEIVQALSAQHNRVHVLARNERNLQGLPGVTFTTWDATTDTKPEGDFESAIDGLVYCPGSVNLKPFNRLTTAEFLQDYKINVEGAVRSVQYFLPALKASPAASVLLFSTVAVQTGMVFHSSIAMAKGAVEGLTRSLAAELAPRIRVNCIAPSLVQTPLTEKLTSTAEKIEASARRHPLGRIGNTGDIAGIAAFLLGPQASWITGQVIHADGGMSALKI